MNNSKTKKIPVYNSDAFWQRNENTKGLDLVKIIEKPDRKETKVFGWIDLKKGEDSSVKFVAQIPSFTEDGKEDCETLGTFDSEREAMEAVLDANHPDYSVVYV